MKKLTLLLLALFTVAAFTLPALAVPGPEPGRPDFDLIFFNLDEGELADRVSFNTGSGWDFGDRGAYRCAWVEHFTNGQLDFRIAFNRMAGAAYMQVNDRGGAERSNDCLSPFTGQRFPLKGSDSEPPVPVAEAGDHFPHQIHEGDGLTFFRNGSQFEALNLAVPACADSYWVNGDEPGEVVLWWDPDGPTGSHQEGVNDLPCGGGPEEPFAVIHAQVTNAAPGVTFCTHSQHEDLCSGAPAPTTTTPVPTTPPTTTTSPVCV